MDSLDIMDKFYEKKDQDMETRLYRLYDEIEGVENSIEEVKNRLLNIRQQMCRRDRLRRMSDRNHGRRNVSFVSQMLWASFIWYWAMEFILIL